MLDVSTAACTLCGSPAKVPEDVVAVKQEGGTSTPIVICCECQPVYVRAFHRMLDRLQKEREGE
jgi:hypothetical protein